MKKNDKIIVLLGVAILIISSIGIYSWTYEATELHVPSAKELSQFYGVLSDEVNAVTVSDTNPFYPLIVTPLTCHYYSDGGQFIAPLYVMNFDKPSGAVVRTRQMIGSPANELIVESGSSKYVSLKIIEDYWGSSKTVILIEESQVGYNLGILAAPLASYFSAPIIVTNRTDSEVTTVLRNLGVEHSLVCGDIEGYGNVLKFDCADDVINFSIDVVQNKFGGIDYITLTNPVDAWSPEVLASESFTLGPMTISSGASTRLAQAALKGGDYVLGTFKIPNDYKYALIKFEGINLDSEDVDEFGDYVFFKAGAGLDDIPIPLQNFEGFQGSTSTGGVAERDANGKLLTDKVYGETVLYDRGGVTYTVTCKGQWMIKKQGEVMANIVVEKLENPVYEMMKGLSSVAPYLTAYHKGIIFGKPEFAFTADDDVITDEGSTSPGFFLPRRNPRITDNANRHFFDVIHKPLNTLLAKIADIELVDDRDLKTLRSHYAQSPVYIALVGGATGLPNFIYQNYLEPVDYWDGQYGWGVGTPSDVPYGNIDPKLYDWSNLANDIFTEYPYQENIVGRITGWDVQDASALVARNIFYYDIIDDLGEWKDTAAVLAGSGLDFQQPPIRFRIASLVGATHRGEPMKLWTGFGEISNQRSVVLMESLGFKNVYSAYGEAASREGFSDEALHKLKYDTSILNKFFFFKTYMRTIIGNEAITGGKMIEDANFVLLNGHGNMAILAMDGIDLVAAGLGGPISKFLLKQVLQVVSPYIGPGASLGSHIQYNTREVSTMEIGPSFVWLESCITGKIDGMYPQGSLGQAFLHAGVASLVASPTGSNIEGGYLEPKNRLSDNPISVLRAYIKAKLNARKGIYPDPHFGNLIYSDMVNHLDEKDSSIGMAFREAKNNYLQQDAGWELWWSPPLITTGDLLQDIELQNTYSETMKSQALEDPYMMKNKYISYQEYMLFGDPAFNPYVPNE